MYLSNKNATKNEKDEDGKMNKVKDNLRAAKQSKN